MLVIFETESGAIVSDEIFVRTGVAYEVRTEVVGERGSALIGLDQNLQLRSTDGRWGGTLTPGFVERFGQAYDVELQRWVDAAKAGTIDGASAWDGCAAVAVCEAGVLALRSGVKVHVHLAGDSSGITRGQERSRIRPDQSVAGSAGPADVTPGARSTSCPTSGSLVTWMELSPKADFVPFFEYPRVDDAIRAERIAGDAGVSPPYSLCCVGLVRRSQRRSAVRA
jgi:hypothetical protein